MNKKSHYFSNGRITGIGEVFMRVPNISPFEIWDNIKAFTSRDRKSLITFLIKIKHPAAEKVREINRAYP